MDQEPVHGFQRDLGQVLVRPVDRVPSLETDDSFPAALGEDPPGLRGVSRELGERRLLALEDRDAAREVERLLRVQSSDTGMRIVEK